MVAIVSAAFCFYFFVFASAVNNYGDLRLVGGFNTSSGRLEIYYSSNRGSSRSWGTICSSGFDEHDADVACQQLGFHYASRVGSVTSLRFGRASSNTPTWLYNVECSSANTRLYTCTRSSSGYCSHSSDVGVVCTNSPDTLRLVSQRQSYSGSYGANGRLEIFINNQWGTVCGDSFGIREARVACRQLGFSQGAISFSTASALGLSASSTYLSVLLGGLNCYNRAYGSDLRTCTHSGVGDVGYRCTHNRDVVLSCLTGGNVRLVSSYNNASTNFSSYGRLEVYSGGRWGTVCDDGFTQTNADVVCRQLGFIGADRWSNLMRAVSLPRAPSSTPILLDQVSCSSYHQTLLSCRHNTIGDNDCSHSEDVAVYCENTYTSYTTTHDYPSPTPIGYVRAVRLVSQLNVTNGTAGRLEVLVNYQWGTVCDDNFGITEATVACRQLGFNRGALSFSNAGALGIRLATGRIWLDDVNCYRSSYYSDLSQCDHQPIGTNNCGHNEDVILSCMREGSVRLVGDSNDTHILSASGRLEFYSNGVWGTVCITGFNQIAADVVCRQLGFTRAYERSTVGLLYSSGFGMPIFKDRFTCDSSDQMLQSCSRETDVYSCTHSQDVAVFCNTASPPPPIHGEYPVRLVGESGRTFNLNAGRLEIFLNNEWGTVCLQSFETTEANVACRQLGFLGAVSYTKAGSVGYELATGTISVYDEASCFFPVNSNEVSCSSSSSYYSCDHSHDVILSCLKEGSVRLVSSQDTLSTVFSGHGRLEVYTGGRWGTVCDDLFSKTSADTVCQQLGFNAATSWSNVESADSIPSASSDTDILLDDVKCSSTDLTLLTCPHSNIGVHNCAHSEDVAIFCVLPSSNSSVGVIVGSIFGAIAFLIFLCVGSIVCIVAAACMYKGRKGRATVPPQSSSIATATFSRSQGVESPSLECEPYPAEAAAIHDHTEPIDNKDDDEEPLLALS